MNIFRNWSEVPPPLKGGVLVLGNFDGLHRGHQEVIGRAKEIAKSRGVASAVMTFEPHPRVFFNPDQEPFRLCPFRMKARLMESLGIDYLYVQTFDLEFSKRSAENFVEEVLVGGLNISHVVVGYDYVFGYQRKGNVELLRSLSTKFGFEVTAIEKITLEQGHRFSSTNVRNLLKEGKCESAAALLGRYWEIEGRVEQGDQRGRQLGFPTANLPYKDYLHPKKGVYAVCAGIDKGADTIWHPGVANFGNRPTFDKKDVLLEVHLLDGDQDLYQKHLRVALIEFLRGEVKFDGLEALQVQIATDCQTARDLLASGSFSATTAPFVSYRG